MAPPARVAEVYELRAFSHSLGRKLPVGLLGVHPACSFGNAFRATLPPVRRNAIAAGLPDVQSTGTEQE